MKVPSIPSGHHVLVLDSRGSKRGQEDFHGPEWAASETEDAFGGRVGRTKQRRPMDGPWELAVEALCKDKESYCYPSVRVKEPHVFSHPS